MLKKYWFKLSQLGVKSEMEIEMQKKIILSNQISVIFFFLFFFLNLTIQFFYIPQSIWAHLSSFTILLMPVLNKFGYNRLTSILVNVLTPSFTILASALAKIGLNHVPVYSYIFPKILLISYITIPFVLIGKRNKILLLIMVFMHLGFIFSFDYLNSLFGVAFESVNIDLSAYSSSDIFIIFPILIVVLGFVFLTNINNKYEDKVYQLVNELEKKNKSITDSIVYAKKIQTTFLSSSDILMNIFPKSFIFYKPKDIVSGDFYWFSQIDRNIIIVAADCTGHGVPGAFMSLLGISFLNDIVVKQEITNPDMVLNELRNHIKISLKQTGKPSESKDGMDISLLSIDIDTKMLRYSGAYNPAWIFRRKSEMLFEDKTDLAIHFEMTELKADHMPIGVFVKEKPFAIQHFQLEANDTVYIFTDGFHSQFGSEKDTKFKTKRLKETLLELQTDSMEIQREKLEETFNTWKGGYEQTDDVLLIGIQF